MNIIKTVTTRVITPALLFVTPFVVVAASGSSNFGNFKEFVSWVIRGIINPTIALLITVAVAFFFWGALKYILSQGAQKSREEGVKLMVRGLIALFFIITFWGFAKMLSNTFI